ncbi:hypothetical protein [Novacetimonas hansenii]|nr:hypothetical protein [Novacetimonas hansenii]
MSGIAFSQNPAMVFGAFENHPAKDLVAVHGVFQRVFEKSGLITS